MQSRFRHLGIAVGVIVSTLASAGAAESVVAVKAKHIYTAAGNVIENGVVLISDGKISGVGANLAIPAGANVIDAGAGSVTPGLIDALCLVDSEIPQQGWSYSEYECPVCAELHRRHVKVVNGGAVIAPGADSWRNCPTCLAEHERTSHAVCPIHGNDAAASPWDKLAANARLAAENASDPGAAADADDDACDIACSGPKTAMEDIRYQNLAVGAAWQASWAEQSSEVVPHINVIDSVNLASRDFKRLAREGVTTVYVAPDSGSVIGSRGAIVKTAGPLDRRIVRATDSVRAALGRDPISRGRGNTRPTGYADFYARRPTTRMGVEFVFRKAFYDAMRWVNHTPRSGADTAPDAAMPVLAQVLNGEIPLRILARAQQDIITGLRLAKEFGLKVTIEDAAQAYDCLPELKAAAAPLIFGPIAMDARGVEVDQVVLDTPRRLAQAGIPFALTAQAQRDEDGLARQAMLAMRYGLPKEAALAAVTSSPAKILGLADSLGTLKNGASADLVIWSGEPFASTSKIEKVLINGEVVSD